MFKIGNKNKYSRGTTLVEIVVVISIFVMISGVTIFNYGQFNSSMSSQNLIDDIALSVRKAQSYAIGVRGVNQQFIGGYGVHFSTRSLVTGEEYKSSNKSFVVFAEMGTKNSRYDYGLYDDCGSPVSGNECMEILKIISTDEISSINLYDSSGVIESLTGEETIDIMFYRPNPEPYFCYRSSPSSSDCDLDYSDIVYVEIEVTNLAGGVTTTRTIRISNSGQISVME